MESAGLIVAAILGPAALVGALGLRRRIDWRYLIHGMAGIVGFAAFSALGLKALSELVWLVGAKEDGARDAVAALVFAFAALMAIGAARMLRAALRLDKPVAWTFLPWSGLDKTLLGAALGFAAYALFG